jgi:hypothetical protein
MHTQICHAPYNTIITPPQQIPSICQSGYCRTAITSDYPVEEERNLSGSEIFSDHIHAKSHTLAVPEA